MFDGFFLFVFSFFFCFVSFCFVFYFICASKQIYTIAWWMKVNSFFVCVCSVVKYVLKRICILFGSTYIFSCLEHLLLFLLHHHLLCASQIHMNRSNHQKKWNKILLKYFRNGQQMVKHKHIKWFFSSYKMLNHWFRFSIT